MGWRFHIIIKSVGRAEEYRRQPYGTDERELVDAERPVGTDHVGHGLVVGERAQRIDVLAIVLGDRLHTRPDRVRRRESRPPTARLCSGPVPLSRTQAPRSWWGDGG